MPVLSAGQLTKDSHSPHVLTEVVRLSFVSCGYGFRLPVSDSTSPLPLPPLSSKQPSVSDWFEMAISPICGSVCWLLSTAYPLAFREGALSYCLVEHPLRLSDGVLSGDNVLCSLCPGPSLRHVSVVCLDRLLEPLLPCPVGPWSQRRLC